MATDMFIKISGSRQSYLAIGRLWKIGVIRGDGYCNGPCFILGDKR
jgi:hypothetical protein